MTILQVVVLLSLPQVAIAASQVMVIEQDVQRGLVATKRGDDPAYNLEIESAPVDVALPSGTRYPGYIIGVRDPDTSLYWWTFQGAGDSDPADRLRSLRADFTFFISENEIMGSKIDTPPPTLWLSRSTSRVESLVVGRRAAVESLARSFGRLEDGTAQFLRAVSLKGQLPFDFLYRELSAMPPLAVRIDAVERLANGWRIHLLGGKDRKAFVELDELLVLRAARELPPPADAP